MTIEERMKLRETLAEIATNTGQIRRSAADKKTKQRAATIERKARRTLAKVKEGEK